MWELMILGGFGIRWVLGVLSGMRDFGCFGVFSGILGFQLCYWEILGFLRCFGCFILRYGDLGYFRVLVGLLRVLPVWVACFPSCVTGLTFVCCIGCALGGRDFCALVGVVFLGF